MKQVLKIFSTAFIVFLALAAGAVIFFVSQSKGDIEKVPSIFGYKPLTILSNSMQPEFNAGDVILIKPNLEPKINDVVTFKHPDGILVTHRIIDSSMENGQVVYITKGDNNNVQDDGRVTQESIIGVQTSVLPNAGHVAKFVSGPLGFILLIGLPVFLFLLIEIFQRTGVIASSKEEEVVTKG
ncbi:signal peptidase I [Bacillus sp. FJAT-45066]|uniref:signal peptidase I n=1 Tax=Bacillus sp. FJAT-45066 TaxID=2011010 RepID=UPI000BB83D65|nr:signal peptidase I [Bacillus sp. FJAT-45066]